MPYSLTLFEFITLVPNTHFGAEYILLPNIRVPKFINLVSNLHFGAEHRRYASKFLANGHWRMATIGSSKMVNGHWPFAENWSQNRRMATPIFVAIHFKIGHSFEMAIRLTGPIYSAFLIVYSNCHVLLLIGSFASSRWSNFKAHFSQFLLPFIVTNTNDSGNGMPYTLPLYESP